MLVRISFSTFHFRKISKISNFLQKNLPCVTKCSCLVGRPRTGPPQKFYLNVTGCYAFPSQQPVNAAQGFPVHVAVSHKTLLDSFTGLACSPDRPTESAGFQSGRNNLALALQPKFGSAFVHHSDKAKAARLDRVAYASMVAQGDQFTAPVQCVVFHDILR